jgi:hypothetical protein
MTRRGGDLRTDGEMGRVLKCGMLNAKGWIEENFRFRILEKRGMKNQVGRFPLSD